MYKPIQFEDLNRTFIQRTLLILGGSLYFVWGYLLLYIKPDSVEPLEQRLFISGCAIITALASFYSQNIRNNLEAVLNILYFFITYHYFYIMHLNQLSNMHIIGAIVVVCAVSVCFQAIRLFALYAFSIALVTVCLCTIHPAPREHIILPAGIFTMLIINYIALNKKLHLLKSLHEYQEASHKYTKQTQNAEKISALARIAGTIAHEINNPITVIKMQSEVIREQLLKLDNIKPQIISSFSKIERNSERITNIIKNFVSTTKAYSEPEVEIIELHEFMSSLMREISQKSIELNIPITADSAPPSFHVVCNYADLLNIFISLINNSFEAVSPLNEKWVNIKIQQKNQYYAFSIIDSGLGIKPEITEKVFEPLFTTKETPPTRGMGLHVAKKILQTYSGDLFYDSEATNTTFIIMLPTAGNALSSDAA